MNYENTPQENKAEILEQAVLDDTPEELVQVFKDLGEIKMTARALGTACRFCGVETVKTLVECGATFFIPQNEATEQYFRCYSGMKYANYRTNYALYLLNITRQIKGSCCCKGLKFSKRAARKDGTYLKVLPDSERAEVLKYLFENWERISFDPSEMLYYAIFVQDNFIVSELEKLGVKLLKKRVDIITNGGPISDSYWYEWISMMSRLGDGDYLPVMERINAELGGKPFHCTSKVYDTTKARFVNADITEFFRMNFRTDKINKTQLLRDLIDANAAASLPIVEKLGWLDDIKRRDEMIEYARQRGDRIECVSFLLDFKNRTADFAAEREKAEKKAMRELNANPNSVTALKKTWSYKKQEDGTLIITNYKGTGGTQVTIPEKIGKDTVTAIANGAFAAASGIGGGSVKANFTPQQQAARRNITRLILPKTLKYIGVGAFTYLQSLEEIVIPEGVMEIGAFAFYSCGSLTEITVPGSVKKIDKYAFANCNNLQSAKICKGVLEIGAGTFNNDRQLKKIELPSSVQRFLSLQQFAFATIEAIYNFSEPTVYCPKGSCAEEYCREHGIMVEYTSDNT